MRHQADKLALQGSILPVDDGLGGGFSVRGKVLAAALGGAVWRSVRVRSR
jgi:hypothetical protein